MEFAPHLEVLLARPLDDGGLQPRHNFGRLEHVEVGRPDGALPEVVPCLAVVVPGRVEAHGVEGVLPAHGEDLLGAPGIKSSGCEVLNQLTLTFEVVPNSKSI